MRMSRSLMYVAVVAICLGVMTTAGISASQDRLSKRYTETVATQGGEKFSFEMVVIPGGSFLMGSPGDEAGRGDNEGPQHRVRLDSFYLCTTETTLGLFMAYYEEMMTIRSKQAAAGQTSKDDVDAVTCPTPVYGDLSMGYGKKNPAIAITWHNAVNFCKWLSEKTGKKYRLPTEAEWEYACRAGATSIYGVGCDPKVLKDYAWYGACSDGRNAEVAKRKPSAWGLYDMLGNVREWVHDYYSPTAYEEAAKHNPAVNPAGPKSGKSPGSPAVVHVARGGDYDSPVEELRCAARAFEEEWWRMGDPQIPKSKWWLPEMDIIGFRVARTSTQKPHR